MKLAMKNMKEGMKVSLKTETIAQISSCDDFQNSRHTCINEEGKIKHMTITTDMIGIVKAIDVPCPCVNKSFLCVDFQIGCDTYRTRPYLNQIKLAKIQ
jgi:hypothetical protein